MENKFTTVFIDTNNFSENIAQKLIEFSNNYRNIIRLEMVQDDVEEYQGFKVTIETDSALSVADRVTSVAEVVFSFGEKLEKCRAEELAQSKISINLPKLTNKQLPIVITETSMLRNVLSVEAEGDFLNIIVERTGGAELANMLNNINIIVQNSIDNKNENKAEKDSKTKEEPINSEFNWVPKGIDANAKNVIILNHKMPVNDLILFGMLMDEHASAIKNIAIYKDRVVVEVKELKDSNLDEDIKMIKDHTLSCIAEIENKIEKEKMGILTNSKNDYNEGVLDNQSLIVEGIEVCKDAILDVLISNQKSKGLRLGYQELVKLAIKNENTNN